MIDFNTTQLTWIVIGACGLGGSAYLTVDQQMQEVHTKVEVTNQKLENTNNKLELAIDQMREINKKLDQRK